MKFINLPSTIAQLRDLATAKGIEVLGDRRKLATYRKAIIGQALAGANLAFQAALALDGFCKLGAHLATRPEAIRFYARTAARLAWAAKRGAADIALTIQLFVTACDAVWGAAIETEEAIDAFWDERTEALYNGEQPEPVEVVVAQKLTPIARQVKQQTTACAWYYLVKAKRTVTANTWYYATKATLAIRKEVSQVLALGQVGALALG